MRDIKTLLEILLYQYKNNMVYGIQLLGLCMAISRLTVAGVISAQEEVILIEHLHSNKPKWAWGGYWWTEGDVPPRIKFLKQLISKLENMVI